MLLLIYVQNQFLQHSGRHAESILFINNIELLMFFSAYYFLIGGQRLLLMTFAPFSQTVVILCSLVMYFIGLYVCHLSIKRRSQEGSKIRFLVPFSIPFLVFIFLSDADAFITKDASYLQTPLTLMINVLVLVLAVIFLPALSVFVWNCPPLANKQLASELEEICQKAGFKHAGLRIWSVMKDACTAAIIGVVTPFRYVLFTQKLLDTLSPEAIKAVLAHEIGHSRKHHLLIYPFVLLGMAVLGTLALIPFYEMAQPFSKDASPTWQAAIQFASFVLFATIVGIYFRFIFGYFSRLFERQADLYVFEVGLPAKDMVEALDTLAVLSGNIHHKPNWHHYSIQQRIDFLQRAEKNPEMIAHHLRRIQFSLLVYAAILIPLVIYLGIKIVS